MPDFNINDPHSIYIGPSSAESPGGFVFGPQGWHWGSPQPKTITFFLDGTAKVGDQFGRPIRGVHNVETNKDIVFAPDPPHISQDGVIEQRPQYATHQQVIKALTDERIDWQKLACAGWPQLPYEELKKLRQIPPTPVRELRKIRDRELRRAALRMRQEVDEARRAELQMGDDEEEELDV